MVATRLIDRAATWSHVIYGPRHLSYNKRVSHHPIAEIWNLLKPGNIQITILLKSLMVDSHDVQRA